MRAKTVLLVSPYFPPDLGGVEQYVDSLARLLHERHGWRVVVVATARAQAGAAQFVDTEYARIYRIPFKTRVSNTPIGFHWSRLLRDIIAREQIDFVNAHAPVPLLADVTARSCGDLPFVLTYHAGPMRNGRALYDVTCSLYERYLLSATARRADQIISSSGYVSESFDNLFAGKVTIISPGVDANLFREGGKRDPNLVLFVGSLAKAAHYKGLPDLITAVSILRDDRPTVRLEVIGDGDGMPDHIALCQQRGVAENVTFAGRLDRVALAAAYQRASVVALPTHYDSFPTVLVEAMSTGRPVVSTKVGGVPTLVNNGVDGVLLTPGDIPALASTIGNLLEDPALATEMGRHGAQKVRLELSWNTQADRTCAVFEKALSLRRRRAPAPTATGQVRGQYTGDDQNGRH
jgi:glycosyltransferase involved in cell wall biosynthesis